MVGPAGGQAHSDRVLEEACTAADAGEEVAPEPVWGVAMKEGNW